MTSLDEEFGGVNKDVASELEYRPGRRRRRYFWFLLLGALVAVTSAVMWPNNAQQLWAFAQLLPSLSTEQTASRGSAESADQLIELDALKKEISEFRYEQQKLSAEISALQTAQQELQRSSAKAACVLVRRAQTWRTSRFRERLIQKQSHHLLWPQATH